MHTNLCECGCGKPTPKAKWTDKRYGHIVGQSTRFIVGHGKRTTVKPYCGPQGLCGCGCGNAAPISGVTSFALGVVKGHPRKFIRGHSSVTHGHKRKGKASPELSAYEDAKRRCTKEKWAGTHWKDYGGRGIEFQFTSFAQFFAELGARPSKEHSLDRKNNDGHYAPGNVRWATKEEQQNNKRGHCFAHGPFSCPHCAAARA